MNQKSLPLAGERSACQSFTDKQGQYLAFIWAYSLINGRAPAERDMQRFFGVTAPSVHQMVLNLERDGLLRRQAGIVAASSCSLTTTACLSYNPAKLS
ncbi:LexA family transcriptional regulator [Ralstonia syzygii]|uniref:MarR family transcriptional regulator n=1 Tax=Ralstonia syzygii TaxID=28097 RepID=UPI001E327B0F|nr:MarR family transcriptional regulator [Ralstonia syzygii]